MARKGIDNLVDYVVMAASRNPNLLGVQARTATLNDLVTNEPLVVDTEAQARTSVLLAEALLLMSADLHAEGDQATLAEGAPTRAEAIVLTKQHGGLRPAARATGYSRTALWRAVHQEEVSRES